MVSVILGLTFGEWLVKRLPFFQDETKPRRKKWGHAVVVASGLLASCGANLGIPRFAPLVERDFLGARDTTVVVVHDSTIKPESTTVQRGTTAVGPESRAVRHRPK